jgi:hypothetical protein
LLSVTLIPTDINRVNYPVLYTVCDTPHPPLRLKILDGLIWVDNITREKRTKRKWNENCGKMEGKRKSKRIK